MAVCKNRERKMVEELMEGVLVRIAGVYEQVGW